MLRCFAMLLLIILCSTGYAQTITDSTGAKITVTGSGTDAKVDSAIKAHSPRKAAIRSALVPGWGQIYNKKYWKLPLVYGALGTTAGIFVYNLTTYRDLRFAYRAKFLASRPPFDSMRRDQVPPFRDSTLYSRIKPRYIQVDQESIRLNRDQFRRNLDYSVLVFILFWGLNVVDASVDAHLKAFDVSPDLSFRFKAGYSDMARTNGLSLILNFK